MYVLLIYEVQFVKGCHTAKFLEFFQPPNFKTLQMVVLLEIANELRVTVHKILILNYNFRGLFIRFLNL